MIAFTNRKIDARIFDIDLLILPCLWASQLTFKGAKEPNLVKLERRG